VKLTTYLHLVPMLGMGRAKLSLPLCAFMAWTGKALPFTSISQVLSVLIIRLLQLKRLRQVIHHAASNFGRLLSMRTGYIAVER